jgi:hypothetical protein
MPPPSGFSWSARQNGDVSIARDGREVTMVRGRAAARLADRLAGASDDAVQQFLARATGNYKRGNERQ